MNFSLLDVDKVPADTFFDRFDDGPSPDALLFLLIVISNEELRYVIYKSIGDRNFEFQFVLLVFEFVLNWADFTVQSLLRALAACLYFRDDDTSSIVVIEFVIAL